MAETPWAPKPYNAPTVEEIVTREVEKHKAELAAAFLPTLESPGDVIFQNAGGDGVWRTADSPQEMIQANARGRSMRVVLVWPGRPQQ